MAGRSYDDSDRTTAGKFIRRLLTGTKKNFWNGQGFMADPTMLVSEGFAAVTSISGIRGGNSIMQIQRMMELNTETGFRHFSEAGQIEIATISGSNFIDKPDARLIPHPDGGREEVTMTLEDGRTVTRELPRVRIVVTFAVFNGSAQNIRTFVTYNDCFGAAGCWSNPKQISQTSGLDQGLSVANIGSKFLYVIRRFADGWSRKPEQGLPDRGRRARGYSRDLRVRPGHAAGPVHHAKCGFLQDERLPVGQRNRE